MLHKDWRDILRKAWSIRLMLLASLLTGCEAILPLFAHDLPRGIFASLSMLAISGGMVARVMAQRNMNDD
jgi:hypothetical protein